MTVGRRGRKWFAKVSIGGRQVWGGTHSTRREAVAAAQRLLASQEATSPDTCRDFADRWLRDYARPAPATRRTYAYAISPFVSEFRDKRLSDVDRLSARRWAKSVPRFNVRVARSLFSDAIDAGIVDANPFANLRLEASRGRRDLTALTETEIHALADTATRVHGDFGLTMRALILFLGFTGARPGEALALEWDDVTRDQVTIARSLDATGNVKPPKNGKPRTIVLPPPAREALLGLPRQIDIPLVFLTKRRRPFNKGHLQRYFEPIRAAFGRPELTPYELRHACATALLERGVAPMDVAQQLGHSDHGRLVQELYGHPAEAGSRDRIRQAFGEGISALRPLREASRE